jgi:tRNA threonylcarbamoyladenosine biosynthesis protein TsaB
MNILALDAATAACSVALQLGDEVFVEHQLLPRQQSEQVLVLVDALLKQANITLTELDLIACGVGPGSFMGCRLAVSVAQGLAFGAELPVLPVSTLQVLAQSNTSGPVLAAWDARMGQLYLGRYRPDKQGIMQSTDAEVLASPKDVLIENPSAWHAVGNAWQVYAESLSAGLVTQFDSVTTDTYPQAEHMLTIATAAPVSDYVTPEQLAPTYLRRPVS